MGRGVCGHGVCVHTCDTLPGYLHSRVYMFWTCNGAHWPPAIINFLTVCSCTGTGTESGK